MPCQAGGGAAWGDLSNQRGTQLRAKRYNVAGILLRFSTAMYYPQSLEEALWGGPSR